MKTHTETLTNPYSIVEKDDKCEEVLYISPDSFNVSVHGGQLECIYDCNLAARCFKSVTLAMPASAYSDTQVLRELRTRGLSEAVNLMQIDKYGSSLTDRLLIRSGRAKLSRLSIGKVRRKGTVLIIACHRNYYVHIIAIFLGFKKIYFKSHGSIAKHHLCNLVCQLIMGRPSTRSLQYLYAVIFFAIAELIPWVLGSRILLMRSQQYYGVVGSVINFLFPRVIFNASGCIHSYYPIIRLKGSEIDTSSITQACAVGDFTFPSNILGLEECLSLISRTELIPNLARVIVAGKPPGKKYQQRLREIFQDIEFRGYISDLDALYAECDYVLVSAKCGSGVPIKALEYRGLPVDRVILTKYVKSLGLYR